MAIGEFQESDFWLVLAREACGVLRSAADGVLMSDYWVDDLVPDSPETIVDGVVKGWAHLMVSRKGQQISAGMHTLSVHLGPRSLSAFERGNRLSVVPPFGEDRWAILDTSKMKHLTIRLD